MENTIKISVKGFGITHTADLDQNVSPEQFIETCCKMAESLSFSPEQVRHGLRTCLNNRE